MASNPYSRSTLEGHTVLGNVFSSTLTLTITAGETAYFNVNVPDVDTASIIVIGREVLSTSAAGFELRIFTNPTDVVLGASSTNRNLNLRSSNTSDLVFKYVTSLSTTGTEIDFTLLPPAGHKTGGGYPSNTIRVYDEGDYLVGIKNLANTNETVYVTYSWIQLPTLLDL